MTPPRITEANLGQDPDSRLTRLEFQFVSLCNSLESRISALEAALAKQRAVNEAMLTVLQLPRHQWLALEAALREALNPPT